MQEMLYPTSYIKSMHLGKECALITDGRVQPANLGMTGRERPWLEGLLSARGLVPRQVFLASLDTHGRMTLQLMGGELLRFQAMEEAEVCW